MKETMELNQLKHTHRHLNISIKMYIALITVFNRINVIHQTSKCRCP